MSKKIIFTENQIKTIMGEAIDELNLYHGTHADFDNFDFAYLSSGWGQQAYGYGFYLTDDYEAGKEYSLGGKVYTVQVPDKGYLSSTSVTMNDKKKIANALFKYYTEDNEDTKMSYPDAQTKKDFWDYEVSCILRCVDGLLVYGTVSSILGSDKEASEFLHNMGYKGLKILNKNETYGIKNMTYVIFDANDMKIINKEEL